MSLSAITKIWPILFSVWIDGILMAYWLRRYVSPDDIPAVAGTASFWLMLELGLAIGSAVLLYVQAYRKPGLRILHAWLWISPLLVIFPYLADLPWLVQLPEHSLVVMGLSLLCGLGGFSSFWYASYQLWKRNQFLNPSPEYKEEQLACSAWMARMSAAPDQRTLEELTLKANEQWPQWSYQINGAFESRKGKIGPTKS